MVFLTESAKFDPALVDKIKGQLERGKDVVITSGLLKALEGKGLEDIVELRCGDEKALVREFPLRDKGWKTVKADSDILIPQVLYPTNDAWELVTGLSQGSGYPLLLKDDYAKGVLYVLTIPDNFADLYRLPAEVLDPIRKAVAGSLPVRLEGPAQVGLFVYDNNTFIVESFKAPGEKPVAVKVVLDRKVTKLTDLVSGKVMPGKADKDGKVFDLSLGPASYRVFAAQ